MPFDIDPNLIENNDVRITTNDSGRFVLEHKKTGHTLEMGGDGTLYTNSLSTERITNGPIYAGNQDGSTPDARVMNALTAATDGDEIYFESAALTTDQTVSSEVILNGRGSSPNGTGTVIDASWQLNGRGLKLSDVRLTASASLTVGINSVYLSNINGSGSNSDIIVEGVAGPRTRLIALDQCAVTFNGGSTGCIIDGSTATVVTDNGSNTIGDIA